jgi:hypothetical protein
VSPSGDTIRDKDRITAKTQIVGLDLNPGGASENLMQSGQRAMANSLPVVLASDQSVLLAAPYFQSSTLYIDSVAYTILRAPIAVNVSGDNPIVAAVSAKQIRVISLTIIAATAVSLYFKNNTTGPIFGGSTNTISLASNGGFSLGFNPTGHFQTGTVNEALIINLSGAVAVAGGLSYILV